MTQIKLTPKTEDNFKCQSKLSTRVIAVIMNTIITVGLIAISYHAKGRQNFLHLISGLALCLAMGDHLYRSGLPIAFFCKLFFEPLTEGNQCLSVPFNPGVYSSLNCLGNKTHICEKYLRPKISVNTLRIHGFDVAVSGSYAY